MSEKPKKTITSYYKKPLFAAAGHHSNGATGHHGNGAAGHHGNGAAGHHGNGALGPSQSGGHLSSSGPMLQLDKTSLHEKTLKYDTMTRARRRLKEERREPAGAPGGGTPGGGGIVEKRESGLSLPEVRGAEGMHAEMF